MSEAEWIAFLARPEFPAFNRAMLDDPEDDLPRLVFADWMDENCPDAAVNAAVRGSIANTRDRIEWPNLGPHRGWNLTFRRGRVAAWVNTRRFPPVRRSPRKLIDGVWRAGWVDALLFDGGRSDLLTAWFGDSPMDSVTMIQVGGGNLWPDELGTLLHSPRLGNLTRLVARAWHTGTEGLARTLSVAPRVAQLKAFSIVSTSSLSGADAQVLMDSPLVSGLEELEVSACSVGDAVAVAVARSPHLAKLKALGMSHNKITDEGAAAIAYSLLLANLEQLRLGWNGITDVGAAALANSPYLCEAIRAQWRR